MSLDYENIHLINLYESTSTVTNLFTDLAKLLHPNAKSYPKTLAGLKTKITKLCEKEQFILVLDEVDRLASAADSVGSTAKVTKTKKNQTPEQQALCYLFSLAARTKLILISISNTLDFTERALPELKFLLPEEHRPKVMNFQPYTKDQLSQIVLHRLRSVSNKMIIPPAIVNFTAMKISSNFGDLRRLLDILKRSVEFVEAMAIKNQTLTPVSMSVVNKIINSQASAIDYFQIAPGEDEEAGNIPIGQALVLVSILKTCKELAKKEVGLMYVQNEYLKMEFF